MGYLTDGYDEGIDFIEIIDSRNAFAQHIRPECIKGIISEIQYGVKQPQTKNKNHTRFLLKIDTTTGSIIMFDNYLKDKKKKNEQETSEYWEEYFDLCTDMEYLAKLIQSQLKRKPKHSIWRVDTRDYWENVNYKSFKRERRREWKQ